MSDPFKYVADRRKTFQRPRTDTNYERLLAYFRSNRGKTLSKSHLIEALYPDPDREPETAEQILWDCLTRLRKSGAAIEHVSGWRLP